MLRGWDERPVLLLAETGFIIRNLILGSCADAIVRHRPLVVAVPVPDDPVLMRLAQERGFSCIPFRREPFVNLRYWGQGYTYPEYWMYRLTQGIRSSASLELQATLWEGTRSRMGRSADRTLAALGRFVRRRGWVKRLDERFLGYVGRKPITREWGQILQALQPAAVVSTMLTHSTMHRCSSDLPVLLAGRQQNLRTGTLVQSWDNLSSKTSILPGFVDRYWTWSDRMSDELREFHPHLRAEQIEVIGSPQFDFHRRADMVEPRAPYLERIGLDPSRPVVVLGTGTARWMPGEPLAAVQLARALAHDLPDCQLLIRLHPKDDGQRWGDYREELNSFGVRIVHTAPAVHMDRGGFVPPVEFYREQVTCLSHAAVIVNTASTLTVDAALLDRPVICLGYDVVADQTGRFPAGRARAYASSSHYGPLVATGGVRLVESERECVAAIRDYVQNPARDAMGRREIVRLVVGEHSGSAGERLAAAILNLAESSRAPTLSSAMSAVAGE